MFLTYGTKLRLPIRSFYILSVLLLLGFLATGCAPKRVVRPNQETPLPDEPELIITGDTEKKSDSPGDIGLPELVYRGKSGTQRRHIESGDVRLGSKAVALARKQLGKQYQWGASGPEKFDCSGLVQYVYGNLGINLPRVSREQARVGQNISRRSLKPGDLLFFATTGSAINHVGIYLGKNEFIHAPRRYVPVCTESLNNAWWSQRLSLARRIK